MPAAQGQGRPNALLEKGLVHIDPLGREYADVDFRFGIVETDTEKTLRTAGYGYANVDQRLPVQPELLFQIGSITKSLVALVLLQLREEGKSLPGEPRRKSYTPLDERHIIH